MRTIFLVVFLMALGGQAQAGTPEPGYSDSQYAGGLNQPTAIAFLPDGRLVITEKGGDLKLFDGNLSTLGNIPVCSDSEMGLLGVAIDPSFGSNGFIYLYRTHPGSPGTCSGTGRVNEIVRVTMSGNSIGSLTVLLTGARTDGGNHDGGVLRIGPDGKLYAGIGDTGLQDNIPPCSGTSMNPYAQDVNELEGKIARINLDGTIPGDNPFAGNPVFALGFRNPFRMSFDPQNGNLWVADVGDLAFEEIDIVTSGKNYGWPHCEATRPTGCEQPGDVDPIAIYSHGGSCPGEGSFPDLGGCIIGGAFAGASFGAFDGDYFFGDCNSSTVYHAVVNGTRDGIVGTPETVVTNADVPSDFAIGPDGALYYAAVAGGEIRRVTRLVAGTDETLLGSKLSLKADLAVAAKQALSMQAKDPSITIGAGHGSGDDPRTAGGDVRVVGGAFDVTYSLPAGSNWTVIGGEGGDEGYRYKDKTLANGPIRSAMVKRGKMIKVSGSGSGLGLDLTSDPTPVDVVVRTGAKHYCTTFGGATSFKPGSLKAKNAPAGTCP
jgi:glucose/arabinose dehydrogenase